MIRLAFILLVGLSLFVVSCAKDSKEESGNEQINPNSPSQTIPQQNLNTNQASGTVYHYICPNNCAGGGGDAQGACPVCGTALAHNDAFHNQPNQANPLQQNPTNQITPIQSPQNPTPPPAQNAAGVYHYICAAGCDGGAATGGSCSNCGGSLVHNQAYHN